MAAILYLVKDLLFTSKIRETARQLGLDTQAVRSAEELSAAAPRARVAILDLRLPDALQAVDRVSAAGIPSIGFVDHERVDLMDEATRRGCTKVLAKGKFSSDLGLLLKEL